MNVQATLIVCERSGAWAQGLRRAAQDAECDAPAGRKEPAAVDFRFIETRTGEDCLAALADCPRAIVAVELTAATCDRALELVAAVAERFGGALPVVLAAREMADYQWLVRELGAAHFVSSPRRLDEIVALAARHARSLPRMDPWSPEGIFSSLPWG